MCNIRTVTAKKENIYYMALESQTGLETACILTGTAVHVFVQFLQTKVGPKENVNMR